MGIAIFSQVSCLIFPDPQVLDKSSAPIGRWNVSAYSKTRGLEIVVSPANFVYIHPLTENRQEWMEMMQPVGARRRTVLVIVSTGRWLSPLERRPMGTGRPASIEETGFAQKPGLSG
jgi:hypothetical protein